MTANSKCSALPVSGFMVAMVLVGLLSCGMQAVGGGEENDAAKVKTWAKFEELPIGSVRPQGWLLRGLELQRDGFMGHLEEIGFPFNTKAWLTREPIGPDPNAARRPSGWREGWNWAMTAKWLEGTLRCGYLLDDKDLIEKAKKRINYNLQHQDENGYFGPLFLTAATTREKSRHSPGYTYAEFLHLLMTEYSASGDERIIEAMKKYFKDGIRGQQKIPKDSGLGHRAGNYQIVPALWLYEQTGDEIFLNHSKAVFALNGEDDIVEMLSENRNIGHGAYWFILKTIPASMYIYTGNQKYLDAVVNGYRKLDRDQMLIGGVPSSSEFLRTNTALDSAEACNGTYYPLGLKYLLAATGEVAYADKIEKAIFNFLPGSMTSDFKAYQYLSSSNQVVADWKSNHAKWGRKLDNHKIGPVQQRMAYRPIHACQCCAGNTPRALPNFVSWMFQKDNNGTLTAVLYGPSKVTTKVGKSQKKITITEQTDYPFSEQIDFVIHTAEPVNFDFRLRIPGWCEKPQVLVNGKSITGKIAAGRFAEITREFKNNDKITLILPMKVKLSHWPRGGIGLERGPLVYALRIKEDWRNRPKILGMREAKELYSTKDFPGWDLYSASHWNYALAVDEETIAERVKVVKRTMNSEPWSTTNAPIELQVPARQVSGWGIGEDGRTPPLPDPNTLNEHLSEKVETVTLVPFGCAKLRIAVFPHCD